MIVFLIEDVNILVFKESFTQESLGNNCWENGFLTGTLCK